MGARSCEASEAWLCSEASEKNVLPSSELEAGEPASDAAAGGGCCLLDGVTDGVAFVDEAESVGVPNVASRSTSADNGSAGVSTGTVRERIRMREGDTDRLRLPSGDPFANERGEAK